MKHLTTELLQEEARFLLKTLLRDDLFGDEVHIPEAEKLLEASLSFSFVEYAHFLKKAALVEIERSRNTIAVLPKGKSVAVQGLDAASVQLLSQHFSRYLEGNNQPSSSSAAQSPKKDATSTTMGGLLGRYEKLDTLGQGSLGSVFRGMDRVLNRPVVIKEVSHVYDYVSYVSNDEITKRVKDAALSQAALQHPHILRILDLDFTGSFPTIVLDEAQGESLRIRMQKYTPLPVTFVVRVILQIAYALKYAHERKQIHGGLKPENVLFDPTGNVRISDFGIYRATERQSEPQSSAPPVYVGHGSPSYMAPEQLHEGKASEQGDIYALGILFYELLCGQLPGRRSPMPSTYPHVVSYAGDKVAAALDDVFDKMTRDSTVDRYKDMNEVLSALYQAVPSSLIMMHGTMLFYERDPLNTSSIPGETVSADALVEEEEPA
jgi:serine/threonine protein kinase